VSDPFYDLTSSSLNQVHPRNTPSANRFRELPKTNHQENLGVIEMDCTQADPGLDAGGPRAG
jgi:hypothetical protein